LLDGQIAVTLDTVTKISEFRFELNSTRVLDKPPHLGIEPDAQKLIHRCRLLEPGGGALRTVDGLA